MEKDKLFDIRTLDRNFEKGLITKKEYEAHLKALSDVEDNAVEISAQYDLDASAEEEE